MVKLFPASFGGPSLVKAIRAPLPQLEIVPVGGVDLNTAADFIRAGAEVVGVGGSLVNQKLLEAQEFDQIAENARRYCEEVERGQVLAAPGSITPHTKFECEVYILSKDEGGRHTPFFNGYRPQFYFRTTDVTGAVELPEGTEMVMPGDNVQMVVDLIAPIAMEDGLRFAIREGGRTVGAGVVSEIIE